MEIRWSTTSPLPGEQVDFMLTGKTEAAGVEFEASSPVYLGSRDYLPHQMVKGAEEEVKRHLAEQITRRRDRALAEADRWRTHG